MTNAEARFNKIHIRKVYACLAVTCHLHFWQNDRDFLRATVVTRGWNGYRNVIYCEATHVFLYRVCKGSNPCNTNVTGGTRVIVAGKKNVAPHMAVSV